MNKKTDNTKPEELKKEAPKVKEAKPEKVKQDEKPEEVKKEEPKQEKPLKEKKEEIKKEKTPKTDKKTEGQEVEKELKEPATNHIIFNKPTPKQEAKAQWFVVHTYSGHEIKVAQTLHQRIDSMDLQDYIFEVLIPTQNKIKISKGKRYEIAEKIFPGYMLIRMVLSDSSWLTVRTTPGITSFVGVGNKPTPLPKKEVEAIQKFMVQEAPKYKASFSAGEAVKIIEGPFSDFLGTVDHIDDEKGKVRVLVSIFGRETPVELDFLQVSKI